MFGIIRDMRDWCTGNELLWACFDLIQLSTSNGVHKLNKRLVWLTCVWYDHIRDGCTGCEPVPVVQCREDAIPFTCVLRAAILLLLSTLSPKWRATSLTLMMVDTQLCTGQPKRASCPWWSTSWDPVDLMWKQGIRLACIMCCLSEDSVTSLDTPAAWAQ